MAEDQISVELPSEKKGSRFPRWFWIAAPILLIAICCVAITIIPNPFLNLNIEGGGYSVESVTLSSGIEEGQPVGIKSVFMPSDTIICTVKTTGWDSGIIGMRWYLGENKIYETKGKTKNNTISTYIQSNKSMVLPEGKYRVEVFMVEKPLETVYFDVEIYHPKVNPPITIPKGHKSIEAPWYPEVPFAFDEIWNIDGTKWKINEVKVILMNDSKEYFVAVVAETDMKDILSFSEDEAKARTRAIALYAIEKGYVDKAKGLEIDGKHYDLDQIIFVNIKNPSSQYIYRVKFTMDELK